LNVLQSHLYGKNWIVIYVKKNCKFIGTKSILPEASKSISKKIKF